MEDIADKVGDVVVKEQELQKRAKGVADPNSFNSEFLAHGDPSLS